MRHKSGKTDQSSFGLRAAAIKPLLKKLLNDILKLEYFTIFSAWVMRNYFTVKTIIKNLLRFQNCRDILAMIVLSILS